ncbi:uncharacterized protein A4U43_C05F25750 [Asparagus officinalis]|uniref:Uncharacterized protein n=1 Tax=Asparagus officinalis TaxID=4686 RepID=A0A5P1EW26_ASPOF|nr:uncharacterized protein A4U43_C05F25750 [Asparagus officinalis]
MERGTEAPVMPAPPAAAGALGQETSATADATAPPPEDLVARESCVTLEDNCRLAGFGVTRLGRAQQAALFTVGVNAV